ncbi:aminotransferase class I/II-fold pyridoxal phosphate-dependent enzyme [Terrimonas pollutisoli]|uniref:aminotransferase class I/II-fold pyridoxal phosphate-dependent enzyme n=1 Tax=Terrimonas pollutisoli TaxID=3034147 RepID=UPI0023EC858F|nr:8-amino-7-oxononanoate synthase [Terrimonas sp. H1YJ31]
METPSKTINDSLQEVLDKRKEASMYRFLQMNEGLIDFCSNDYLSFARSEKIKHRVKQLEEEVSNLAGSTGSRSISGNTSYAEELERFLAGFHHAEAGLLFNSGYDANVGLFSSIAKKDDTLLCDELIHASMIDGCRLSYANRLRFAHNDTADLEKKLQKAKGNLSAGKASIFVAIESVYSMDGDMAPLPEIVSLCKQYNAHLIVDEAHATGVFGRQGRGLVNYFGLERDVFARVHTFGKAVGCHGAVVVGSDVLRNYLINFARSFIFTTALPLHSLFTVKAAYEQLMATDFDNAYLHQLIEHFKKGLVSADDTWLINSIGPIQSLVIPGSERARHVAKQLQARGFDVRAIVSPSVAIGKERLRISLHMHNTMQQLDELKHALNQILFS